ncbi:unnamed protein product, partial [Ascophyllum nodosum]
SEGGAGSFVGKRLVGASRAALNALYLTRSPNRSESVQSNDYMTPGRTHKGHRQSQGNVIGNRLGLPAAAASAHSVLRGFAPGEGGGSRGSWGSAKSFDFSPSANATPVDSTTSTTSAHPRIRKGYLLMLR